MRGVPATWGVRLCGPGAGKLGYRPGHTGTSSVVVRGVSVKFDSREPKEQEGSWGWTLSEASLSGGRGAGGDSGGHPLAGPRPAATRRLGGEGGLDCKGSGKDEAGETAAASSRPRAEGTGEGQAPRGPIQAERSRLQGKPSLHAYLLASLCLVLGPPRDQGSTGCPGAWFAASCLPDTEPGSKGSEKAE